MIFKWIKASASIFNKKRLGVHFDPETLLIDSLYIESCFLYIKSIRMISVINTGSYLS